MNEFLINAGKVELKELLSQCTEGQQYMFKRMYAFGKLDLSIDDVVDKMDEHKIDWALQQCQKTVDKNNS